MTRIARDATRKLQGDPRRRDVGAHVGRAVTGDQVVDVNSSELWVNVDSDADYDKTVAAVRRAVAGLSGLERNVVPYTQQKIRDVGTLVSGGQAGKDGALDELTGTRKPLVVRVFGEDLAILRTTAEKVRGLVAGVDGVVDPKVELPTAEPTIEIETKLDAARRHGIKPGDVRRAEAMLLQGIRVGSIFGKQKVFDVVVQGVPATAHERRQRPQPAHRRAERHGRAARRRRDGARQASARRHQARCGVAPDRRRRRHPRPQRIGRPEGRRCAPGSHDVPAGVPRRGADGLDEQRDRRDVGHRGRDRGARRDVPAPAGRAAQLARRGADVPHAAGRARRRAARRAVVDGTTLSLGALLGLLGTFAIAVRGALVLVSRIQRLEDDEGMEPGSELVAARRPRAVRPDRGRSAGDCGVPAAVRRARLAGRSGDRPPAWRPSCSAASSPRRS